MQHSLKKIHVYIGMFFLPMAFIFAITGIAYIFGIREDFGAKKQYFEIPVQDFSLDHARTAILDFLQFNELPIPRDTSIRRFRGENMIMGTASYSILIKKISGELIPRLEDKDQFFLGVELIQRSLLGQGILLHKAKVGIVFVVFSVIFGFVLIFSYLSGIVILARKYKKSAWLAFIIGFIVTLVCAVLSL